MTSARLRTVITASAVTDPWLTAAGRPVAPLEVAVSRAARRRGLLGRDCIEGALLLAPAGSIHTVGMRFAIDAALCDSDLRVVRTVTLRPGRLTRPRWRVRAVIETEAGALARWGIEAGTQLGVGAGPDSPPAPADADSDAD